MGVGELDDPGAVHWRAFNAESRWPGRGRDKALLAHDLLCYGADAGAASRELEEDDDAAATGFQSDG